MIVMDVGNFILAQRSIIILAFDSDFSARKFVFELDQYVDFLDVDPNFSLHGMPARFEKMNHMVT